MISMIRRYALYYTYIHVNPLYIWTYILLVGVWITDNWRALALWHEQWWKYKRTQKKRGQIKHGQDIMIMIQQWVENICTQWAISVGHLCWWNVHLLTKLGLRTGWDVSKRLTNLMTSNLLLYTFLRIQLLQEIMILP